MSVDLNSNKLHVIIDRNSFENFQKLIEELENLEFLVEKKEIGKNFIQIPPNSGVFIIKSKDLDLHLRKDGLLS